MKKYDKNGNVIYQKRNGVEWWKEYDENNNLIHIKNSHGYEESWKYDENNNIFYYKDSNGFESWRNFDRNNNLIYYKDSNGFEEWKEYENNNMIHCKNSNGVEYWNEYDKDNNLIHTKHSTGYEEWKEYDENGIMIHYKDSNGYVVNNITKKKDYDTQSMNEVYQTIYKSPNGKYMLVSTEIFGSINGIGKSIINNLLEIIDLNNCEKFTEYVDDVWTWEKAGGEWIKISEMKHA